MRVVIALVEIVAHAFVDGERTFGGAIVRYGMGALAGSTVARRIGGRRASVTVPLLLGVLAGVNVMSFPHPGWFVPTAMIALGSGWLIGSRARIGSRHDTRTCCLTSIMH